MKVFSGRDGLASRRALRLLALFPALVMTVSAVCAQKDAPAVNADQMLRDLGQLEKKRDESVRSLKSKALATLQPGAANAQTASKLFADAIAATRFDGRDSNALDIAAWNRSNAALLRSHEMQEALQLHLRYLVMALQRGDSNDAAKFAAQSYEYARALADYQERMDKSGKAPREALEILGTPINKSPFVQWLSLAPWLPSGEDWEPSAGNLDKILEKNVRPAWRAEKSPEILQTWDFQMKYEADRATATGSDHAAGQFNALRREQMLFGRAQDAASIGMTNRAAHDIFELLQKNPGHPDFSRWATELRRLLEPSPTSEPTPAAGE